MKNFTILFISLILAIVAGGQDLNEILESHFAAIGQDKVLETESFEIKAKINQGGMDREFSQQIQRLLPAAGGMNLIIIFKKDAFQGGQHGGFVIHH